MQRETRRAESSVRHVEQIVLAQCDPKHGSVAGRFHRQVTSKQDFSETWRWFSTARQADDPVRAGGKSVTVQRTPAIKMALEQALPSIEEEERVEVTPKSIRLRKKPLTERSQAAVAAGGVACALSRALGFD